MIDVASQVRFDSLIGAVNVELEAGNWSGVVALTHDLYMCALEAGETQLADLVQDLHWIANDALAHPVEVAVLVQP